LLRRDVFPEEIDEAVMSARACTGASAGASKSPVASLDCLQNLITGLKNTVCVISEIGI
jgi:hypothetical protein